MDMVDVTSRDYMLSHQAPPSSTLEGRSQESGKELPDEPEPRGCEYRDASVTQVAATSNVTTHPAGVTTCPAGAISTSPVLSEGAADTDPPVKRFSVSHMRDFSTFKCSKLGDGGFQTSDNVRSFSYFFLNAPSSQSYFLGEE